MIVLDTHALIWAVQDDSRLGSAAAAMIEAAGQTAVMVPAICAWEIGLIEQRGSVVFPGGALQWLEAIFRVTAFRWAPLEPEIAVASIRLDWPHRDPADRMIVATARHWDTPLVTADRAILGYAAAGHVKAIDARA